MSSALKRSEAIDASFGPLEGEETHPEPYLALSIWWALSSSAIIAIWDISNLRTSACMRQGN
jgi:hypothetical protein